MKEPAPWFGCGKIITQKSWDAFLKARKEYWQKKDAQGESQRSGHPAMDGMTDNERMEWLRTHNSNTGEQL